MSRFHFMLCRYFLGHVACRNLPWRGLRNGLRDLEAELLSMVCKVVEVEPVLQDIAGEEFNRGTNTAPDARERQRSAFFDVRVCQPNVDSYRDMDLDQIFRQHETEKKRQYAGRV